MANDQIRDDKPRSVERTADMLIRVFEDKIKHGELKDGDPLPPEREIVETYGVSRTVVREAVQALANRGLVEARPRFRPVVRRPSYEAAIAMVSTVVTQLLGEKGGVRNLFETRTLIEAGLVRHAADAATPSDISKLARALHANKNAIEDSLQFYDTDRAFHRVFYEISGNPVLVATHKAFVQWLSPHWEQMPHLAQRNTENFEAHQAIFDAIQNGDADTAETALRRHLEKAWDQVRDTFG